MWARPSSRELLLSEMTCEVLCVYLDFRAFAILCLRQGNLCCQDNIFIKTELSQLTDEFSIHRRSETCVAPIDLKVIDKVIDDSCRNHISNVLSILMFQRLECNPYTLTFVIECRTTRISWVYSCIDLRVIQWHSASQMVGITVGNNSQSRTRHIYGMHKLLAYWHRVATSLSNMFLTSNIKI
jgi:hypothetical protein